MEAALAWGAKICANDPGHVKVAATPKNHKNPSLEPWVGHTCQTSKKNNFNPNWKKVKRLLTFLQLPLLSWMSIQLFSLMNWQLKIRSFGRRVWCISLGMWALPCLFKLAYFRTR